MINNQLKVLMLGWELPPHHSGGLGVACLGLTKGLAHNGVNISFALPRRLPANVSYMEILDHHIDGVDFTALNSLVRGYESQRSYSSIFGEDWSIDKSVYGYSLYDEAQRYAVLAENWSRTKPHNLIHVHDWMTYPAGIRAKSVSGKPLIAHIHATEFDRTGGNVDPRIAETEYLGLNSADKVIAVSHYTKQIVHDKYSIPLEKIAVVHNGVDAADFTLTDFKSFFPHDKVVIYVGRLTFQKGVEYFLTTAKKVLAVRPDTVFVISGSGDMERHLIMQAAYMGIGNRIIFAGHMTGDNLKNIYQMADAFMMPSISEPYGIVALEAAIQNIPIIISKQSGVSETLEHVAKADFWDTDLMTSQLLSILNYPSLAKERALLAHKEAESMTWNKAALKTLSIYQGII